MKIMATEPGPPYFWSSMNIRWMMHEWMTRITDISRRTESGPSALPNYNTLGVTSRDNMLTYYLLIDNTNYSMFSEFQCFFECFSLIWVYFFLIRVLITSAYFAINLQDPHHAQKCSVHKSLLGTYEGNYQKRWVLWNPLLPPTSLPGFVWIWSGHMLEQYQLLNTVDVDRGFCTATGTLKCTLSTLSLTHSIAFGARFSY